MYVLLLDISTVFYYPSVSKGVPRELCAHDVSHKRALMRACMCSHRSDAAIITAYFRLEGH